MFIFTFFEPYTLYCDIFEFFLLPCINISSLKSPQNKDLGGTDLQSLAVASALTSGSDFMLFPLDPKIERFNRQGYEAIMNYDRLKCYLCLRRWLHFCGS